MRKFLRELAVWKEALGAVVHWRQDPDWTAEDRAKLAQFLASPTGRKLDVLMINQSIEQDRLATLNTKNLTWCCGYAGGFRGAWATTKVLSATDQPEEVETTAEDSGELSDAHD